MTPSSRHFGPIEPGAADAATTVALDRTGDTVEVRLLLADAMNLRQDTLDQVDAALDFLTQLDERARSVITTTLADESSVPGQAFTTRNEVDQGRQLSPDEFTRSLRIASVVVTPDGGAESADRVAVTYVSASRFVEQRFVAIVREGVGLVFAADDESRRPVSSSFGRR